MTYLHFYAAGEFASYRLKLKWMACLVLAMQMLWASTLKAESSDPPNVVFILADDLNDVAWSPTTRSFLRTSGLQDPRRGRGFFNTFHADHLFLRFPLDHIFHSPHFTVSGIYEAEAIERIERAKEQPNLQGTAVDGK